MQSMLHCYLMEVNRINSLFGDTLAEPWVGRQRSMGRIAQALSRINRFAGDLKHNVLTWTDLHHSIAVYEIATVELARRETPFGREVMLHALTHDVVEVVNGDHNGLYKADEARENEDESYDAFCRSLGIPMKRGAVQKKVKEYDRFSLYAEFAVVAACTDEDEIAQASLAKTDHVNIVESIYHQWPNPSLNAALGSDIQCHWLSLVELSLREVQSDAE